MEEFDETDVQEGNLEHVLKMARKDVHEIIRGVDLAIEHLNLIYRLCEEVADDTLHAAPENQKTRHNLARLYHYTGRLAGEIYFHNSEIEWARRWNQYLNLALTTDGDDSQNFTMFLSKHIGYSAKILFFRDGERLEMALEWFEMHRQAGRMLNGYIASQGTEDNRLELLNATMWESATHAARVMHRNTNSGKWKAKCEECAMRGKAASNHIPSEQRREIIEKLRGHLNAIMSPDVPELYF